MVAVHGVRQDKKKGGKKRGTAGRVCVYVCASEGPMMHADPTALISRYAHLLVLFRSPVSKRNEKQYRAPSQSEEERRRTTEINKDKVDLFDTHVVGRRQFTREGHRNVG